MNKYIIIGNGTAAIGTAEGIRSCDSEGEITIISEENRPAYCRPLISYYLENKTTLSRMNYRSEDFYEKNNCKVLYGQKAVKIDPEKKMVTLSDGESLSYTALSVCTGSSPFTPPFRGLDKVKNKFSFMTLDDTLALEKAVTKETKVLIAGAGLIGLKCAEGLKDHVKSITVFDLADRVLSSIFDRETAIVLQQHLENNGISFSLSDTAESFEENKAFMKSGKVIDFDLLVLAVGVRPNVSLVKEAGGEVNRGIIVNSRMQTSIADVYAAGDCTESEDISSGKKKVMALMPSAYIEGHTAGVNMAGGSETLQNEIPMNSIGFFGLHAMTAGTAFSEAEGGNVIETKGNGKIKKLFIKDDVLTGFMIIGETERAGIYTSLIRERTPLSSIDFELMKKFATNAAFSKEIRGKKFAGVV